MIRLLRSVLAGCACTFGAIAFIDVLPRGFEAPFAWIAMLGPSRVGRFTPLGASPLLVGAFLLAFSLAAYAIAVSAAGGPAVAPSRHRLGRWAAQFAACLILFTAASRLAQIQGLSDDARFSGPLPFFIVTYAVAGILSGALFDALSAVFAGMLLSAPLGAVLGPSLMHPGALGLLLPMILRSSLRMLDADIFLGYGLLWATSFVVGTATWGIVRLGTWIARRSGSGGESLSGTRKAALWATTAVRARWREAALIAVTLGLFGYVLARLGPELWPFESGGPLIGAHGISDSVLTPLLKPDRPLHSAHILETRTREAVYVADLQERPPRGYESHYLELLKSRGVFIRPSGGSAHAPRPIDSYEFIIVRPGVDSASALSLRYLRFWDRKPEEPKDPGGSFWWPITAFRPYPSPVHIEGRRLSLRLGYAQFAAWDETWPLPVRDEIEGPELPLPRFPGAVVRDWGPEVEDRDLLKPSPLDDVSRLYSIRGVTQEQVVAHYEKALHDFGVAGGPYAGVGHGVEWWGKTPVKGVVRVAVSASTPGLIWGAPLDRPGEPEAVKKLLPRLEGITEIRVSVRFEKPEDSLTYWPDALRRRRELLLAKDGAEAPFVGPVPLSPSIAVLSCGSSAPTVAFLRDTLHEAAVLVSPDRVSVGLLADHRVLVVPSQALDGLSAEIAANVGLFVKSGGVVIALTQLEGRAYDALPVPPGERLRAIGFGVDQEVYARGVRVDQPHPALASLAEYVTSMNVDGAFEEVPASARVLLRKTKSDLPVLVLYPVGRGWVVLSSSFDECLSCQRSGPGRPDVLRDLLSWARDPADLPWHAPGTEVKLAVPLGNRAQGSSDAAILRLLSPARDRIEAESTVSARVGPREDVVVTWSVRLPDNVPRGIHHVTYALLDAHGGTLQPAVESPTARVVVGTPPTPTTSLPDLGVALLLPKGMWFKEGESLPVEYRVENRLDHQRRLHLYWNTSRSQPQSLGERVLAPHGRLKDTVMIRPHAGERAFWLHVFEVGGVPRGGGPRATLPGETAAFQLSEGAGIRVKTEP